MPGDDGNSAPLTTYIAKARSQSSFSNSSDTSYDSAFQECVNKPLLFKGRKNRLIYYIGSFNPPHIGHQALVEHVLVNTSISNSTKPQSLNAIGLVIVLHGEKWIERKLRESQSKGSTKQSTPPLHLTFQQRAHLVRVGLSDTLMQQGVWVFPDELRQFYTFQNHLFDACREDGFELELIELLGPDYVPWSQPQCSGRHGVVTSNISRVPDFTVDGDSEKLLPLNGFGEWTKVSLRGNEGQASAEAIPDEYGRPGLTSVVWSCHDQSDELYHIWFVQSHAPPLDSDMSSTRLRHIFTGSEWNEVEAAVKDYAMGSEQLLKYLRVEK